MRAVLDTNVIVSATLSPVGPPAKVLEAGLGGEYGLIVSPALLMELERVLTYPKLRKHIDKADAVELLALLRRAAEMVDDPPNPPDVRCSDPDDDYLIALAASARSVIVSGDAHLLELVDSLPVYRPAEFLVLLANSG